jgi:hypothetical protein
VILLVSPDQSLSRRGKVAERPRWAQWFDEGLLERLHTFYTDVAPTVCPSPPLVIDTDGVSPDTVLAQVAGLLSDAGHAETARRLVTAAAPAGRPELAAQFAGTYEALGGLEALGHPFTVPIAHRGGTVQLCQLGALHRDRSGRTGLWDLLAAGRLRAA